MQTHSHLYDLIRQLIREMGEDPHRPELKDTPQRMLQGLKEICAGYHETPETVLSDSLFEASSHDLVSVVAIPFYSVCEHHVLPFMGHVSIGYYPQRHITGLSRLPKLVHALSKRLQVQERLTNQIAQAVMTQLQPLGVGVVMEARHMCMEMRGGGSGASCVKTSCWLGNMAQQEVRYEFLSLASR